MSKQFQKHKRFWTEKLFLDIKHQNNEKKFAILFDGDVIVLSLKFGTAVSDILLE